MVAGCCAWCCVLCVIVCFELCCDVSCHGRSELVAAGASKQPALLVVGRWTDWDGRDV